MAFAALRGAAAAGGVLLSKPSRELLRTTFADWDTAHAPLPITWLDQRLASLREADRPRPDSRYSSRSRRTRSRTKAHQANEK
jgi:hypothetical protein